MAGSQSGRIIQVSAWDAWPILDDAESYVATSAAVAKLVDSDPDALCLMLQNIGANPVYISIKPTPDATHGQVLVANAQPLVFNVGDHFTLPKRRWYASSPAGASLVYVIRTRIAG